MDYRRMFDDKEHLYAFDLPPGKDVIVKIARVTAGEVMGEKGRKSKKPVIEFVGEKKKLAINKTNGKTIAKLYGKDTDDWEGKYVALYATTTEFGGDTVDCIRVKPQVPQQRANGKPADGKIAPQRTLTDDIAAKIAEQASHPDAPDEPGSNDA